jgi:hypothetical protein
MLHRQPGKCRIVEGGDLKKFGFFGPAAKRNLQEDIEDPGDYKVYTAFKRFCDKRGYTVPTINYVPSQTTKTTVEYNISSIKEPLDKNYLGSESFQRAEELVWVQLKSALIGDKQLSTPAEVKAELKPKKGAGFYGRFEGAPLTKDIIARAEAEDGDIITYSKRKFRERNYPCVFTGKMKSELVSLVKLMRRKQRMFMMPDKTHVALHKYFYSAQSKRLRKFKEIAHGLSWFYGAVHQYAEELNESPMVQSEDDEFWDKSFPWMEAIYKLRNRAQDESVELTPEDKQYRDQVVRGMREVILVLPTGDVVLIIDRLNPSGSDATTENNCIARCLVEAYMQVKYYAIIEKPIPMYAPVKRGTKYLGDDRTAGSRDYPDGYLQYYESNVYEMGVRLKTILYTKGAEGAEFAGFKIARSHWNPNYYVPHYSTEKLWVGMFTSPDTDPDIIMSKFMAFSLLLYPRYEVFSLLRPHVVAYLQTFPESVLRDVTISFWHDEAYLRRAWTGHESELTAGGGIFERCPTQESKCALRDALKTLSTAC